MRNLPILFILTLVLTFGVSAQTIKTDEARKLKEVEKSIRFNEIQLESAKRRLKDWSPMFDTGAKRDEAEKKVTELEAALLADYEARKQLLMKPMTRQLPNTQIELLKLLILQNEKIIDLLEDRQR